MIWQEEERGLSMIKDYELDELLLMNPQQLEDSIRTGLYVNFVYIRKCIWCFFSVLLFK